MKHQCRVTVLAKKCFDDLQEEYLSNPKAGACDCLEVGDVFLFQRDRDSEDAIDDFFNFGRDLDNSFPCAEAWDCISRYIYTALQGGSIMHGWTKDDRVMIACCNDGSRPVIFKIERIDIPDNEEERKWLEAQDFSVPRKR
ncbi:MAG: TIGR04076 family protein [Coriobacteriales bacterium]|jgi:uncharacterized repeat protein (TIGR04076 family)